jgi:hypothetical protein
MAARMKVLTRMNTGEVIGTDVIATTDGGMIELTQSNGTKLLLDVDDIKPLIEKAAEELLKPDWSDH